MIADSIGSQDGVPQFYPNSMTLQQTVQYSVWVFAAVYRLAATLAATDFKIVKRGTKDVEASGAEARRVREVLERANDEDTQFDLIEAAFVYLNLVGENYFEKARNRFGDVRELHSINPDVISPIPDKSGSRRVRAYRMRIGGDDVEIPASEIIPTRVFNPQTPYRGTSPVAPVRREIASDVQAALYNLSLLQQGAKTGGILSPEPGVYFSEERFKRLVSGLSEQTAGAQNAGRMLVLPEGLTFIPDSQTLRDMDFLNLRKFGRECVAAAIGVPPMLINDFDSATYANSEQQLKAFWDYVGKPWLKKLYGSLNEHWVHPDVSTEIKIVPDIIGIDAMVDSEESRVTTTSTLYQSGIITQNEARQRMGYGPVTGGDLFMLPLNLDPATSPEERRDREDSKPEPTATPTAVAPDDQADGPADGGQPEELTMPSKAFASAKADLLDDDARKALQEAHLKALNREEDRLAGLTLGFLAGQQKRTLDLLRDVGPRLILEEWSVEAETRRAFEELGPEMARILIESGERQLSRLGRTRERGGRWRRRKNAAEEIAELFIQWDLGNPQLQEFLKNEFFGHLNDINAQTLKDLKRAMSLGVELGEGVSELFVRIEEMSSFSQLRAERIARTETIGAVNKGALESFVSNGTPLKSWLSVRDGDRVRHSHAHIDEVTSAEPIPARDRFLLFDEERGESTTLEYPGDQGGAAWATVNCRCGLRPREEFALHAYIRGIRGEKNGRVQVAQG